jgi:uncharacterized protein (TIGR02271 family)
MITQSEIQQIMGADVYGQDGDKVGSAGQVYLDNVSGEPQWVSVRTGLFGMKESFVPLHQASFTDDRLQVPFGKDQIKGAPQIDPDGDLSPAEEDKLYTYYGFNSEQGQLSDDVGGYSTDSGGTDGGYATDSGYASGSGYATGTDTVGHDTSGPNTDAAMTRSEEHLVAGTRIEQSGTARLRKYVVTEQQSVTVPVSREEVRLEREPITDANVDRALDGPAISEEEHEVTLTAERPVVTTEAVPVERVRLNKETVTDQETVAGEVRKEQIDLEGDSGSPRHGR